MSARRAFVSALFLITGLVRAAGPAPAPTPRPSGVWIGVFYGDAVDGGVQIIEVVPEGPAAQAGLTSGDLVIRIDGKDVADRGDLSRALEGHAPGDTVRVTVLREGEAKDTKVVLAPPKIWKPPIPPVPPVPPVSVEPTSAAVLLGIRVQEVPEDLRKHLGGPADAGLLVMRVEPSGISSKALKPGDLLTSIGGTQVATEADLDRVVLRRSSGPVALAGRRSKESFTSEVSLRLKSPEERARESRVRALENTIRMLEAKLVELKRQLEQLSETP